MANDIQAIRGMKDYLPVDTIVWQRIEEILKQVLYSYGYSEIRLPIVEYTPLFKCAIGKVTDIVEKEMYTFSDRNGESLTLRPEGTVGCVRAGIEHSLIYNQEQRLWYMGPMFRYERPQKGRYRQFYQIGVEVFGLHGPDIDAELIMMTNRWWKILDVADYLKLEINSIGSFKERASYCEALVTFLKKNEKKLDEDCKRRMQYNPIRVLDSKNPEVQELLNDAPILSDYLDKESHSHFNEFCALLDSVGITYNINQRLVRGLDYYNRTVFEWVTTSLGAQGAICAGGRYDGLVERLCQKSIPGIGFAVGMERLILLIKTVNPEFKLPRIVDIYVISYGQGTRLAAIKLVEQIRDIAPSLKIMIHFGTGTFKKQFARANKLCACVVLILGEDEIKSRQVIVKDLRNGEQQTLAQSEVAMKLLNILS